jgi:DNA-binding transcriptional ArsR family regulator
LYVERDDALSARNAAWDVDHDTSQTRNPFAARGSRVPRWLLLHHTQQFSVSEIAHAVDMSSPAVSRLVRALDDRALTSDAQSDDARRRQVALSRPRALLDEWARHWQRRRIRRHWWDIGARDAEEALAVLAEVAAEHPQGWAIGGLAAATYWQRAVEPADVLVWTDAPQRLTALAERLDPQTERGPGRRGSLRVAVAPDPWVLTLSQPGLVPVADPVQVWLDCATEGERALEAADAVAEAVGW